MVGVSTPSTDGHCTKGTLSMREALYFKVNFFFSVWLGVLFDVVSVEVCCYFDFFLFF